MASNNPFENMTPEELVRAGEELFNDCTHPETEELQYCPACGGLMEPTRGDRVVCGCCFPEFVE